MTNLVINTQNIKFSLSDADFTHDLNQALVGADVLLLQECAQENRHAIIRSKVTEGYSSYLPSADHVQRNNPILWRTARFELMDCGSEVLHRSNLFPSANRNFNWVRLKDVETRRLYTIIDFHAIPNVDGGDGTPAKIPGTAKTYPRHKLFVQEMQLLAEFVALKKKDSIVFLGGDWNVKLEADIVKQDPDFPYVRMGAVNLKTTWELTKNWPDTHGKNSYDGLFFTNLKTTVEVKATSRITNTKSDHEGTTSAFVVVPMLVNPVEKATANGSLMAQIAFEESAKVGVPFWVTLAFLEQETGGGQNIYGHDRDAKGNPRPFWGHGNVTKENYAEYLIERDMFKDAPEGRRAQGVGPLQLTFWSLQDAADALGGAWDERINIRYGLTLIKQYHDAATGTELQKWQAAALKYNGKQSYVDSITPKFKKWKSLVG